MKIIKLDDVEGMTFPARRTTRVLTGPNQLPVKNFTSGYVVIQPNGRIPLHAHSNEEIYILLKGTGKMRVGSKEERIEAVSGVFIEPNSEHLLQNIGDDELVMIFVYSPAGVANHWSEEMAGKLA
ncbi:MAG: cupin domain-containing protein [Deltaproteobacteria bacterium]|nr:cupin domain-containing protein [Deltaproteobacteria bacterium]